MRLEGTLDAFGLPDLFSLLRSTSKTGTLHLSRGEADPGARAAVHLEGGAVSGATPDTGLQVLARRLIGSGRVRDEDLASAVAVAVASAGGPGVVSALVDAGALTPEEVRPVAHEQACDAVFEVLRWPDGEFSFHVGEPTPDPVGLALDTEALVAEARDRLQRWETLRAAVPSPTAVPVVVAPPAGDTTLGAAELALLTLLDGRRTVRDVAALSGRGEFAVVEALAGLVDRGLVCLGGAGAVDQVQRRLASLRPLETGTVTQEEDLRTAVAPTSGGAAPAGVPAPRAAAADRGDAVVPGPAVGPPTAPTQTAAPAQPTAPTQPTAATQTTAEAPRLLAALPGAEPGGPSDDGPSGGDRHGGRPVTPARHEVRGERRPDHPELFAAHLGGGPHPTHGATARQPDLADAAVSIDPAVTTTMLMRLIAGVKGL